MAAKHEENGEGKAVYREYNREFLLPSGTDPEAIRSSLSKDGIRHYEYLGLIHSRPVQAGSRTYRDYDDDTMERLSLIALAKRLHFSLKELAEPLDLILTNRVTREERAAKLSEKLAEVDAKIADLQAARAELVRIIAEPEKPFVDGRLKALGLWME